MTGWWRRRDPDAVFDSVIQALRPLLDARGFRQTTADDAGRRSVTFDARIEAVRVSWDADFGAFALEAREPEYEGSWADIALFKIDPPVASDRQIGEMIGIFREALTEYFTDLGI